MGELERAEDGEHVKQSQSKSDFIDVIVVLILTVEQIEYELNEN